MAGRDGAVSEGPSRTVAVPSTSYLGKGPLPNAAPGMAPPTPFTMGSRGSGQDFTRNPAGSHKQRGTGLVWTRTPWVL